MRRDSTLELGNCRASFYRCVKGHALVASFQDMSDAIRYSEVNHTDVYLVQHYEHGVEERLFSQADQASRTTILDNIVRTDTKPGGKSKKSSKSKS